jgi:quaternary ammonium compound-resistance protein SugE
MAWINLLIAGLLEIVWAVGLKYSDGFSRLWPSVFTIIAMIGSFIFLTAALKTLQVGTAYAIWTGIGAAGTAVMGILLFSEPATAIRLLCIALILAGILGLKLTSAQ